MFGVGVPHRLVTQLSKGIWSNGKKQDATQAVKSNGPGGRARRSPGPRKLRGGGGSGAPAGSGTDSTPAAQQVRVGDRLTTDGDPVHQGTSTGTLNGVQGTFTCAASGCALNATRVAGSDVRTVTGVVGLTFTPATSARPTEPDTGSGSNNLPVDDIDPIVRAANGSYLRLSNAQIRRGFEGIQARATALDSTDYWSTDGREDVIDCYRADCEIRGTSLDFEASDAADLHLITYSPVMERNGVNIAQGATPIYQFYGGWMDHGAFFVGADDTGTIAFAMGTASGSPPTGQTADLIGTASYNGTFVGADLLYEEGVQGDALLTVDFADSRLDADFTNIRFIESGELRIRTFRFNDVSMYATGDATGFDKGNRPDARIQGTFYGPGFAEIGGIAEFNSIIGAFGARRQ